MNASDLLDDNDLAELCSVAPSTVKRWRRQGTGPRVVWLNHNTPRYRAEDVRSWLEARAA